MINWQKFQVHLDWLGHMIEATCQALIIAAFIWFIYGTPYADAMLYGGAVAVGHFWGREKRDYENETKMPPPQLNSYAIWKWSYDGLTDFLPVAALYAVYIIGYIYIHPQSVVWFPLLRT